MKKKDSVAFGGHQWNEIDIAAIASLVAAEATQRSEFVYDSNEERSFYQKFCAVGGFDEEPKNLIGHRKSDQILIRHYTLNHATVDQIKHAFNNPPKPNYIKASYEWYASKPWAVVLTVIFFLIPSVHGYIELINAASLYFFGVDSSGQ